MEDLFSENKVQIAVDRIKEAYIFSQNLGLGKLYVCFSGGKDSVCIYHLCKMASEQLGVDDVGEYHYNVTNLDHPELVHFVRKFKDVKFEIPKNTFWKICEETKMMPTRIMRFCCAKLKEKGGEGRFCVTGVRWAESARRRAIHGVYYEFGNNKKDGRILNADNEDDRRTLEHCIPKRKYICNPIVDWEDYDVWSFIKDNGFDYCSLYDKGYKRLGCIMCPMATPENRQRGAIDYPKYVEQYKRTIAKIITKRKEDGLILHPSLDTPDKYFDWWLSGKDLPKDEDMLIVQN